MCILDMVQKNICQPSTLWWPEKLVTSCNTYVWQCTEEILREVTASSLQKKFVQLIVFAKKMQSTLQIGLLFAPSIVDIYPHNSTTPEGNQSEKTCWKHLIKNQSPKQADTNLCFLLWKKRCTKSPFMSFHYYCITHARYEQKLDAPSLSQWKGYICVCRFFHLSVLKIFWTGSPILIHLFFCWVVGN